MKILGIIVLTAAITLTGYAFLLYDPTVGSTYNIGKLSFRQNLVMVGGFGAIAGVMMLVFGRSGHRVDDEIFLDAIQRGDIQLMERMIDDGLINPNGHGQGVSHCWLRVAAIHQGMPQVKLLLHKGADPKMSDGYEDTLLDILRNPNTRATALTRDVIEMLENPPPPSMESSSDACSSLGVTHESIAAQLSELADLKVKGLLSQEEFAIAKTKILGANAV